VVVVAVVAVVVVNSKAAVAVVVNRPALSYRGGSLSVRHYPALCPVLPRVGARVCQVWLVLL
jgi:hypothetical protein